MRPGWKSPIVLAALLVAGCMSSRDPHLVLPDRIGIIPAVVSVRASDPETAESVAADLMALQIFGSVRVDDGSISDHDLLAIHQPRTVPIDGWFCSDPPGLSALLSLVTLMITPSCVLEQGYDLELLPNGSLEKIRVVPEYRAITWLGLQTLLMNFSPNWHWGLPDDAIRRRTLLVAISARRPEILRSLRTDPEEAGGE